MRSIFLDELTKENLIKIKSYLNKYAIKSPIENLYWLYLKDKTKDINNQNKISIEITTSWIKFELLIRTNEIIDTKNLFVNDKQLLKIYDFIKKMVAELDLISC